MTSKRGKNGFLELVKTNRPKPVKPPHLLALIEKNLLSRCEQLLKQMFLATDDLLYDLSNRAQAGEDDIYFGAMREIRIERQGIVRNFLQTLSRNFSDFVDNGTPSANAKTRYFSAQTLSIMDSDELEIDLALSNMVQRAREAYKEPLHELTMRINHLLLHLNTPDVFNPLDPRQIAQAFIEACANRLDINIKARLILLKSFEHDLLKQLAPVYKDANQLLLEAGILPKVPRQPPSGKTTPKAPAKPDTAPPEPTPDAGQPHFKVSLDTLTSLMAAARSAARSEGRTGAQGQTASAPTFNCYIFSGNPGPLMSSVELTSLLTHCQLLADHQLSQGPRNLVGDIVSQLLAKANADAPQALAETDETIINLVSMFFDEILEDDNLPLAVHALVCRLQIPVLKVALQDNGFFSNPDHAARKLINTITEAGIGFDDSKPLERDPVYRKMVDIVQAAAREYKISEAVFSSLNWDLKALFRAEKRKTSIVEKRTSQSAAGRAKIRNARINSQNLLYRKLREIQLPADISEFLTTTWLQVLIITQLKHGLGSAEWISNEQTLNDLVWLCRKGQQRQSQRCKQLRPELMQRVEAGLEAAIENPELRATKVEGLENALNKVAAGSLDISYRALTDDQIQALDQEEKASPLPNRVGVREDQPRNYGRLDNKFHEEAQAINEGTWVEYMDESSGKKRRYKLAAKIDSEAYVFVNRMGFKTLERTRKQFAYDLQVRTAKPLASDAFFDRIMNQVLSHLNQVA